MNYVILSSIFGVINTILYVILWWYKYIVTTNSHATDKEYQKAISAHIFASGFWMIALGSFLLFGGSTFFRFFNFLLNLGGKSVISWEETFLINFVMTSGLVGMIMLNKIWSEGVDQTKKFRQDAHNR